MFEVGRLCVKIAGRDAGKTCVVVDNVAETTVLVDGETRRKNCNVKHLEPLNKSIKIKKGASKADVKKEFEKLGLAVWETKSKKPAERPKKQKKRAVELDEKPKEEKKSDSKKKSSQSSKEQEDSKKDSKSNSKKESSAKNSKSKDN